MWLCSAPKLLQRGLRQEGIFGRLWYHNLSFTKENTGWGEQDPEGLLQVLDSQEATKPPPYL